MIIAKLYNIEWDVPTWEDITLPTELLIQLINWVGPEEGPSTDTLIELSKGTLEKSFGYKITSSSAEVYDTEEVDITSLPNDIQSFYEKEKQFSSLKNSLILPESIDAEKVAQIFSPKLGLPTDVTKEIIIEVQKKGSVGLKQFIEIVRDQVRQYNLKGLIKDGILEIGLDEKGKLVYWDKKTGEEFYLD